MYMDLEAVDTGAVSRDLTVEECRAELREMFGDNRDYEIRLRNWGAPVLICVITNAGLRMDFKGDTPAEAMAKVRQWRKEQQ